MIRRWEFGLGRMGLLERIRLRILGLRGRMRLAAVLPPGGTEEEAIELIASSDWARNWAKGIAELAGYREGTPEYNEVVERLSKYVARRFLGW